MGTFGTTSDKKRWGVCSMTNNTMSIMKFINNLIKIMGAYNHKIQYGQVIFNFRINVLGFLLFWSVLRLKIKIFMKLLWKNNR